MRLITGLNSPARTGIFAAYCEWCSIKRSWRSRWMLCGYCRRCHEHACNEAGIYLQSGGPDVTQGGRLGLRECCALCEDDEPARRTPSVRQCTGRPGACDNSCHGGFCR